MNQHNTIDWRMRADSLSFRTQAFIGGRFVDAASGDTFEATSPVDGRVLGQVAACQSVDVDRAVASARAAFEDGRWSRRSPAERKAVLLAFSDLIRAHRDELALTETLDMGKPISTSLAVDVRATANCFSWYAEAIDKVYDEIAPTAHDTLALITREPLGVVAAVVPWNFPMIMAAWKLAPALAAGNSVVLKPAEQSSLTALRLAELAVEAGLPEGVFNVTPGMGPAAGKALGLHMDVDGIFFTGSTEVGKYFMQYAGQSNLKKIGLECGGKSPNVILSSYRDIDGAAAAAAAAIFFNQGEMCTAGSRLIVEKSVHDRVVERILAAAREQGAMIATGGNRARVETGGCYVEPTVFDNVTNDMRVAQEEIFGPMLSVIPVADAEEAAQVANDTCYGLASAVWTDDINVAHLMARRIRAGMVYVNCYDADEITVPFGGYKQSGIGRDKSLHAFDKYTELKTTWIRLSA
jgi:gamma-glutamyl-gamma-aminobutyraldehyde dehydrogenase/4-guanidinobutyraldehyde dehydrogenase/NAD-dependent aldehyde dehydrogenase